MRTSTVETMPLSIISPPIRVQPSNRLPAGLEFSGEAIRPIDIPRAISYTICYVCCAPILPHRSLLFERPQHGSQFLSPPRTEIGIVIPRLRAAAASCCLAELMSTVDGALYLAFSTTPSTISEKEGLSCSLGGLSCSP